MPPTRTLRAAISLGLLVVVGCGRAKREAPPAGQAPQGPLSQDRRFSGEVRLQTPGGTESVRVEITNVDLRGGHTIDRLDLPFDGTLMAYLQAGDVTTTINGKKEPRRQGQIWAVPPGVPMGLATGRDAASLQTILVGR